MNPIEAVARALAKCGGTEWDCDPRDPEDVYMGMARAALIALRDNGVTEGMREAWYDSLHDCDEFWPAMINAALES